MPAGAESAAPEVFHLLHLPAWESAAAREGGDEEMQPEMCGEWVPQRSFAWKDRLEMLARKMNFVREMGIHVAGCVKGGFGGQEVVSVVSLK